ncbi:carbon-nitrogen hydrolase family protein [Agromyces sp. Soil535]|uniref:carbon-nitrogen hydrolase family protein n=1 Tax=Agromyces sp. Soil535 TaxID=1736390 RepID=UPI0007005763|nr:carbon-nitrogen hydrolase family protein [Agromyces sp. Soil535]KRE24991.1 amidohydrolase [Agromyces sp. Soil535]
MSTSRPPFLAAVVQASPIYLDIDATVDKTIDLIGEAARGGAKLIAFPETWIPGYPYWAWLDSQAWAFQWVQRYVENSFVVGSEHDLKIRRAARDNDIHVVLGYSERDAGSLYIGQMLINNSGSLIAARRKLKPTHVERTVFGEGDGSDLKVHDTELGRLGALSCWEHFQPLTRFAMYSQNEQIHVGSWPSASLYGNHAYALGAELNTAASRTYAAEGGCFVLAAWMPISSEIIELLADTPAKRDLLLPGGGVSRIFGPDGADIASPLAEDEEGILYATIDLSAIAIAKAAADPAGHYARSDVTRLLFNPSRQRPVHSFGPAPDGELVDTDQGFADFEDVPPLEQLA